MMVSPKLLMSARFALVDGLQWLVFNIVEILSKELLSQQKFPMP